MKVKDVMSKAYTISSETTIEQLHKIFRRIPSWCVYVTKDGKVVGIITRNDLSYRSSSFNPNESIEKIMSFPVYSININADVEEVESILTKYGISALAVSENGKLCGVVSWDDLKKAYTQQSSALINFFSGVINFIFRLFILSILILIIFGSLSFIWQFISTLGIVWNASSTPCAGDRYCLGKCWDGCGENEMWVCTSRGGECRIKPKPLPTTEQLFESPKNSMFFYVLRGEVGVINYPTYNGLNSYLKSIPRTYYCDDTCPTEEQIELRYINEPVERDFILPLLDLIRSLSNNTDDQVRIAVSMVQHIPYDNEAFETNNVTNRYPYEVLYDNKGVCGEKSRLLAFILKELGYGVVLLHFEKEDHMAVGIKCPQKYSYITFNNNSYCFIETTRPGIITNAKDNYVGVGTLTSNPDVYYVGDGASFDSVEEEYLDAIAWNDLSGSGVLPESSYKKWEELKNKYRIIIDYK